MVLIASDQSLLAHSFVVSSIKVMVNIMNKISMKWLCYIFIMLSLMANTAQSVSQNDEIKIVRHFWADLIFPESIVKGRNEHHKLRYAFLDNIPAIKLLLIKPGLLNKSLELGNNSLHKAEDLINYLTDLFSVTEEEHQKVIDSDDLEQIITKAINNIPDTKLAILTSMIDALINSYDFAMIASLGEKIHIPSSAGKIGDFIKAVIVNYFPKQTSLDKRFIVATLLRETMPNSEEELKLLAIIKAAGPFFHKIIQLVGDYIPDNTDNGKRLRTVLNEVKRNLLPISDYDLHNLLKEVEEASLDRFKITVLKTLGIASVGHALLVELTDVNNNKSKIVLKFIKPGVKERAQRDIDIILPLAHRSGVMSFFAGTIEDILSELDFDNEYENLSEGNEVYNTNDINDRIKAVAFVPNFPISKKWLAMSLAPGSSLAEMSSKLTANNDEEKLNRKIEYLIMGMASEELANKWMKQAFFGKRRGFYHGDLHAGNMLIDINIEAIKQELKDKYGHITHDNLTKDMIEKINKTNYTLTLIDFGNVGHLDESERLNVINFFISTINEIHSADGFLESYLNLVGKIDDHKQKELRVAIKKIFDEHKDQGDLLGKLFSFFLSSNYPQLPTTMASFGRSQAMLNNVFDMIHRQFVDRLKLTRESFNFSQAIFRDLERMLAQGTLLVFSRVDAQGNQLYLNIGNLEAVAKYGIDYGIQWIKDKVKDKLSIGKMPLGGACSVEIQCQGFSRAGRAGVACCNGVCQVKKRDWAGVYYCPHECRGKAFRAAGSCN